MQISRNFLHRQEDSVAGIVKQPAPISAFVICLNEEDHIGACLDSLNFCDEIVVIDSGSTDATLDIARSKGAIVYHRDWTGYREQKAFGLSKVSHEWVINLDADERVSDELRAAILAVLNDEHKQRVSGFYVSRVVNFLGRWWRNGGWYPEYRLRFFKKSQVVWGGKEPHEKPIPTGATERIGGEIYHFTYRNISEQILQLQKFSSIAAQEDFISGKRWSLTSLLLSPVFRVLKFYVFKRGYREGIAGLIVAVFEGFYTFMKYAKLWELEHMRNNKDSCGYANCRK